MKPAKNIFVVGAAGHAKVVFDILEKRGEYRIAVLFDVKDKIGTNVCGYEVRDSEDNLLDYVEKHNLVGGIVAIGDNSLRRRVVEKLKEIAPDMPFVSAVHPQAIIGKGVKIGTGTVVVAGAVINADAIIGNHCILNTNSSLGHEAEMKDFSSISPNVSVGGNTVIGEAAIVSMGATVIHNRRIGEEALIGAGAVVIRDVADFAVVYGNPAKFIKSRKATDKYL